MSEMGMVERVARAISNPEIWLPENEKTYGDMWVFEAQRKAREKAREAIEAMREPTEEMQLLGLKEAYEHSEKYFKDLMNVEPKAYAAASAAAGDGRAYTIAYRAMIDTALG
jgi:hypothetical protein